VKILDKYLVKSFIPPFLLATFIALFVLIMQTLWLYVDDILGKGASLLVVLQLLFYLSMSLVPMSLPIGVLLSSVMLFGNLSERFELSSMKSIGLSMLRIMRPLIITAFVISIFSYIFYDSIIPYSNLKYKSRLYDLSRQKPVLSLDEQAFNTDFQGFNIYFKKKMPDGRHIEDVIIYQGGGRNSAKKMNTITASSGEMFNSKDQRFFIMKLYDGYIYKDMAKGRETSNSTHPFLQTKFKTWTKVFDMSEFSLDRTNEELFKSNKTMKNTAQLRSDIDSFNRRVDYYKKQQLKELYALSSREVSKSSITSKMKPKSQSKKVKKHSVLSNYVQKDNIKWDSIIGFIETFPRQTQVVLLRKLKQSVKRKKERLKSYISSNKRLDRKIREHTYELNIKYSFALACLLFLFIGAPMGAIIRKGGFGYPILVSVGFFVVFILTTILCKKLMSSGALPAFWAAWIPLLLLVPIGVVLTYKSMVDSRFDWIGRIGRIILRRQE